MAWVVATLGLDMATAGATAATCRTSSADFGWALGGRLLVNLGNALGTTYLLYFLQDDLELDDPDGGLLLLSSVYVLFTHGSSVWAGRASAGYPVLFGAAGVTTVLGAVLVYRIRSVP